jgi:hypothetical protein
VGQTPVPADLQMSWLMQIEHIWSVRDKLGIGLAAKPGEETKVASAQLIPMVKEILQGYRRFGP